MNKLVKQVAEKFSVTPITDDTVRFFFGEDEYVLTDGTLYAVADGQFLPSSKKVKTLLAVENFVADRS